MPVETIIGLTVTVLVLSYLVGDNFLYRLAMHLLVGVGAAYVVAIAVSQVLLPSLIAPLATGRTGESIFALFGLLGCVFLLAKLFRRAAWLGNVAVGYMLGAGAAVAVGGALLGTLASQTIAATTSLNPRVVGLDGLLTHGLILLGTILVLLSFVYSRSSQRGALSLFRNLGRGVLSIAFGATFALVFIAGASVLTGLARDVACLLIPGCP